MFGGTDIAQQRPAESMAGETSQQPELKRLNIENETEPEALNTGQPKLLNNDRRYWLEFTLGARSGL
jgi:hypothetical protein